MNKPRRPKAPRRAPKRVPVPALSPDVGRMIMMLGAALTGDTATMAKVTFDLAREALNVDPGDAGARARFLEAHPLPHPGGCICPVCCDRKAAAR